MSEQERNDAQQQIARDITFQAGRAMEGSRPLFLIVYYEHEDIKITFLNILRQTLRDAGLGSQTFDPTQRPEHGAGRLYPLLVATSATKTLALITGIPRHQELSDPSASFLDYLNLHRDRIARDRLRLTLFLHSSEAERFMSGAGDLWDFRHHTYWLEGMPKGNRVALWQAMEETVTETALSDLDKEEIAQHLREARSLLDRTADEEGKAFLYLDLSSWLTRHHVPSLGAETALAGLQNLATTPSFLRANLEHELGYALQKDNNYSDALIHYERSLAICREIGNRSGEGFTLNGIAMIYKVWGRYDEALQALVKSLAIRREIGDRISEGTTLNNISQIYDAWGRYDEALQTMEESLAISREIGDRLGESVTLNNISQIYHVWGRYDEALQKLEESLAIRREIGDRAGEGIALNNISQIYKVWGRYDEALQELEKSLAIRREIGDLSGAGVTLNNISQIYNAWGRYDEALKTLEESLVINREIGDRSNEGVVCWNLALVYQRFGDFPKAIEFARRTVEIEEELHHPDSQQSRAFLQNLEKESQRKNKTQKNRTGAKSLKNKFKH